MRETTYISQSIKQLQYILIFILFGINLFSKDDFEVIKLDNPAPGYLKIDRVPHLIDNYGKPVFSDKIDFGTNQFKLLNNGIWAQLGVNNYYLYDKELHLIDSIANPSDYLLDPHDIISLSNGHYLILCQEVVTMDLSKIVEGGNPNASIISNVLIEVGTDEKIYWQWRAIEHTQITDIVDELSLNQYSIDFTHINSMDEDSNGNILVSIRHFDEIALISKTTGSFIWRLGGSKSKNNNFTFINDTIDSFFGFSHQHWARFLPNGNILLYDNGNLKPNTYSRVVEYSLDFNSKIANKVWEYRHSPDIYNGSMGSVQRLENGNTLINYSNGKILEIKPDKTISFEINNILGGNFIFSAQKTTLNAVYSQKKISKSGNYTFNTSPNYTGVRLDLEEISDSSQVYIQLHNYAPPIAEYDDSTFTAILPYRWVITSDKKLSIIGTISIDTKLIKNVRSPEKIKIYHRNAEASGTFRELKTTFNNSSGELSASIPGFGEFAIASSELIKPQLLLPADDSGIDISGSIIWAKSVGASKYRLQISDTSSFLNLITDTIIENATVYNYQNLTQDNKYYWRVKAVSSTDSSQWSDIRNFITANLNNNISLKFPANEQFISDTNFIFEWVRRADADFYMLQISNSPSFDKIIYQENNIDDYFFQHYGLNPNSTYFWRLCFFKNNIRSDWSDTWSFITPPPSFLPQVELISPNDNKLSAGIDGQLIWEPSKGAKYYQITVSTKNDFSKIELSKTNSIDTIINYSSLDYDTKYYWRVAAINDTTRSDWSDYRTFITELEAPKIIVISDNQEKINPNGLIRWYIKNDFYAYNIQISKNLDFSDLVVDSSEILDRKFKYSLEPNSVYYCRVKTYNSYNSSKWSGTVNFETHNSTTMVNDISKDKLEIFPNPVTDILNIKSKITNNFTNIKIFDMMGNLVLSENLSGYKNKIDVSQLNNGLYLIRVDNQNGLVIKH